MNSIEATKMAATKVRKPWEGRCYRNTGLLLLGESNYWSPDGSDDPDITAEVVELVASGAERKPHFTKLEMAVTGCMAGQTDPTAFWQTVAYANFCQGATPDAGTRPTPLMWASGVRTFPILLGMLKPRRMVAFGKRVWFHFSRLEGLDWEARAGTPIMHGGKELETGYLVGEGGALRVHCLGVPHPASRDWGNALRWHPAIRDFLEKPLS